MQLDTEVYPTNLCHFLKKGLYQFNILIGANNIKPVRITLEINHTGRWFSDESIMLKEGIFIRIIY